MSTGPSNLNEQIAMKEIMENPYAGLLIRDKEALGDSRWSGWNKLQFVKELPAPPVPIKDLLNNPEKKNVGTSKIVIHYVGKFVNNILTAVDDFKFTDKK